MKNYIAEFMKENDLRFDERFNITGAIKNPYYFNSDYDLINRDDYDGFYACHMILRSPCLIEKIKPKPKTLLGQLKEQGHGYRLNAANHIMKIELGEFMGSYLDLITQGNVFFKESDALRESYRRELEFDMQEWVKENDDREINWEDDMSKYYLYYDFRDGEVSVDDCAYFKSSADFDVYVYNYGLVDVMRTVFRDKIKKYYEWEIK